MTQWRWKHENLVYLVVDRCAETQYLLVDEFGKVVESICGQSSVEHWLALLGAQTETAVTEDDSVSPIIPLSAEETEVLDGARWNLG